MRSALLIKPQFSIFLCGFFLFVYSLGFVLCWLASMPWFFHLALPVFVIVHFAYVLRRFVLYRHPLSIQRLWCDRDGCWSLQCRDAHVRSAKLLQFTVLSRYLVLLSFKVPGRFFPMVLPLAYDSDTRQVMYALRYALLSGPTAERVSL
jgi:hypothetical protein